MARSVNARAAVPAALSLSTSQVERFENPAAMARALVARRGLLYNAAGEVLDARKTLITALLALPALLNAAVRPQDFEGFFVFAIPAVAIWVIGRTCRYVLSGK